MREVMAHSAEVSAFNVRTLIVMLVTTAVTFALANEIANLRSSNLTEAVVTMDSAHLR
ncbi:MAG: hypothetical protein ACTS6A_01985 [Candidatus Hodgkinia cicadicola]